MTDIQQRIADILGDEWTDDIGNPPLTYEFENIQRWAEHVAGVLVSELGLTRHSLQLFEGRLEYWATPSERVPDA